MTNAKPIKLEAGLAYHIDHQNRGKFTAFCLVPGNRSQFATFRIIAGEATSFGRTLVAGNKVTVDKGLCLWVRATGYPARKVVSRYIAQRQAQMKRNWQRQEAIRETDKPKGS